jgi:hypothetical protein
VVRRKPLLRTADIHSDYVYEAQSDLVEQLSNRLDDEGAAFRSSFGKTAARQRGASSIGNKLTPWERRLSPNATFQIHRYKLFDDLTEFLPKNKLAWRPDSKLADGPDYLELHPRLVRP